MAEIRRDVLEAHLLAPPHQLVLYARVRIRPARLEMLPF
jgi:hypothetical protein